MFYKRKNWTKRIAYMLSGAALVLSTTLAPVSAVAEEPTSTLTSKWISAAEEAQSPDYQPSNYATSSDSSEEGIALQAETLPAKYDLRDFGVVTPVKFQNPWGTC